MSSYSKVHHATDYKVMGHDEHSYTVQHPDGHHFKVAKHGLSEDLHKKIQSFADGGMVRPDEEPQFDPILAAKNTIGPPNQLITDAPPVPGSQLTQDQLSQTTAATPAQPSQMPPKPQDPYDVAQQQFEGSIGEQEKALGGAAAEEEKLGQAQAKVSEKEAVGQQDLLSGLQDYQKKHEVENNKLYQDIMSQKVDPNRLWNSKSTMSQISTSIGLLLGGIGAGLTHTDTNPALDVLNTAISRDIDSQKANIENKHNLFNENLKQMGDKRLATLATANQLATAAKAQLTAEASKAQGPLAKQQALLGIGQLDQQIANRSQQMALLHANNVIETSQFDKGVSGILTPEQKKRAVLLDNGNMALATDESSAKDVRDTLTQYNPIMKHLDTLDSLQGLKAFTPENTAAAKAAGAGLSLELDRLHGLKRISDSEYERTKEQIGNPSTLKGFIAGKAARDVLRSTLESEKDSTLKNALPAYKSPSSISGVRPTGKKIR